ncbi:acyl-CoA dehydrogenase family protein [Rhodococcus opacus]|nr:acyl-CoA dehydrogenase family protein [Rhodococcus opacus]
MDVTLSAEARDIQRTARAFVERELLPLEPVLLKREIDGGKAALLPDELAHLQKVARDSGLWGIDLAPEYGGAGLDTFLITLINIELGRTLVRFKFGGSPSPLPDLNVLREGPRAQFLADVVEGGQISVFALTEPRGGSDAGNPATVAVRDGNEWVINGEKTFISRADIADYAFVAARTTDDTGETGVTLFMVERAHGFTSSPVPVMQGAFATGSLSFQDVRVPDENVVGEVNKGLAVAMAKLHDARVSLSTATNIGASDRLLEMMIAYAGQRTTFGAPLSSRQSIQEMVVESEIEVRSAKLLALHAARKLSRGEEARHDAAVAKLYAARACNRIVDRALQVHGGMGMAMEMPIQWWYRALRVERIWEGSDQMMENAIQRTLVGKRISVGQL